MDIQIDSNLVKELIKNQFPDWAYLPILPVFQQGHDNRTFRLGDDMAIRLPSSIEYAPQAKKETFWLPRLQPYISTRIPTPLAIGKPDANFYYDWSINKWIDGETLSYSHLKDMNKFALDLAKFLKELQAIDTTDAPVAGIHNFYRGGDLSVYDSETRNELSKLNGSPKMEILKNIWDKALESKFTNKPVWLHGDIAPGNIILKDGMLNGVIDFGMLAVGDPSCDYAIAWTFFDEASRYLFLEELDCDEHTCNRAMGWAIWKALITVNDKNKVTADAARRTIDAMITNKGLN